MEERSRAFAYLIAFGSIGQTAAALVIFFKIYFKVLETYSALLYLYLLIVQAFKLMLMATFLQNIVSVL